jgi:dihydrofolate reductase
VGNLIYSTIASLDGYIADEDGNFDWGQPDEEVHAFVNDLTRGIGTHLLGRKLYEVMVYWEDPAEYADWPDHLRDFADIWQAADKIVYSTTLESPSTARTRIEREFDPDAVRELKERAERNLAVGGPNLASSAFRAGLIDECQLFLAPAVVGGGTRFLPDDVRLDLDLVDERRFGNGFVFVRYAL